MRASSHDYARPLKDGRAFNLIRLQRHFLKRTAAPEDYRFSEVGAALLKVQSRCVKSLASLTDGIIDFFFLTEKLIHVSDNELIRAKQIRFANDRIK